MSWPWPCPNAIATTAAQEDDLNRKVVFSNHITRYVYVRVLEITATWPGCNDVRCHVDYDSILHQSVALLCQSVRISPTLNSDFRFSSSDVNCHGSVIMEKSYDLNSRTSISEEGNIFSSPAHVDRLLGPPSLLCKGYWKRFPGGTPTRPHTSVWCRG